MNSVITVPKVHIYVKGTLKNGDLTAPTLASVYVGQTIVPDIGTDEYGSSDSLYSAYLQVTSGTPMTIDLTTLVDPLGNSLTMARVQGIWLNNLSSVAGQTITLQGGVSNPLFSDVRTIQAGGIDGFYQPYPGFTTSPSVKTIKITVATGTNVQFALAVLGCSL